MITIRQATLEDVPVLLEFEQGVIEAERPMDSTLKEKDAFYYDLPDLISDENVEIVVAEIDHEIVGSGYAKIKKGRECFTYDEYAYFGFMYTKPEYRGKGVNKLVIEHLYDWSYQKGISEVRLTVYPDNPSAIKAYEKVGMKSCLIEMRIDLRERVNGEE